MPLAPQFHLFEELIVPTINSLDIFFLTFSCVYIDNFCNMYLYTYHTYFPPNKMG